MRLAHRARLAPWGLVGMIALIGNVEGFLHRHRLDLITTGAADWSRAAFAARTEAPGSDVLILGDSLVKYGVHPRVLEARLGKPATNLAIYSGRAATTYFQLRRALFAGSRPRAILVDFDRAFLAESPSTNAASAPWGEFLTLGELFELSRDLRDSDFFLRILIEKSLDSIRHRHDIRHAIVSSVTDQFRSSRLTVIATLRNLNHNRGAHVHPQTISQNSTVVKALSTPVKHWQVDPIQALYLKKTFDLATSHQIDIYWLFPPLGPTRQAREDAEGDGDRFAFAERVATHYPSLKIVDGRHSMYGEAEFVDGAHLDRKGAESFSHAVAMILRAGRGSPAEDQLVTLPRFQSQPREQGSEDMYESLVYVSPPTEREARR